MDATPDTDTADSTTPLARRAVVSPAAALGERLLSQRDDGPTANRGSESKRLWMPAHRDIAISVVMPAYNAGDAIRPTVDRLVEVMRAKGIGFELIVVSDGSTDDSMDTLRDAGPEVRIVELPRNRGKGGALHAGFSRARGAWVGFVDCDGDIDPASLVGYLQLGEETGADIVYANKRHGESVSASSPFRKFVSRGFSGMVALLFGLGIEDTQTGCKLMRREVMADVLPRLRETRFAFDLEFFVAAREAGYSNAVAAPVELKERMAGSTVTRSTIIRTLQDALVVLARRTRTATYRRGSRPLSGVYVRNHVSMPPPAPVAATGPAPSRTSAADGRREASMPVVGPSDRTTVLLLSWRDIRSPKRGGAEIFTHEMMARADQGRFRLIHVSPMWDGAPEREVIDGVEYLRMGTGALSVIREARRFFRANEDDIDFVVDQCNTHRFFTRFWVPAGKRIFFIHQLTREIWHINARRPISTVGAMTETPFLRLSRNDPTITVSPSTRQDLLDVGFDPDRVTILPEGIDFEAWDTEDFREKEEAPTFIYVGRFVNYKGIDDSILAFARLRADHPGARLWIVGRTDEEYVRDVLRPILDAHGLTHGVAEAEGDVVFHGFVSDERKLELMSRAHALLFPSQREGWGLIITEAGAVGTPSIGYDSPGIVDALDYGRAGYLCPSNSVDVLADQMRRVIEDGDEYETMRSSAHAFARQFHWDRTGAAFDTFMTSLQGPAVPTTTRTS